MGRRGAWEWGLCLDGKGWIEMIRSAMDVPRCVLSGRDVVMDRPRRLRMITVRRDTNTGSFGKLSESSLKFCPTPSSRQPNEPIHAIRTLKWTWRHDDEHPDKPATIPQSGLRNDLYHPKT